MSQSDNPRIFTPSKQNPSIKDDSPEISTLIHHDPAKGIRHLLFYPLANPEVPVIERRSLVFGIHGRCQDGDEDVTGKEGVEEGDGDGDGYAVYFARESGLNFNGVVLPNFSLGEEKEKGKGKGKGGDKLRNELYALKTALGKVRDIIREKWDGELRRVVVLTDEKEMVEGLSVGVWEWEFSGYKDEKGKMIVNADGFKEVNAVIGSLEREGIEVCFWLVGRFPL